MTPPTDANMRAQLRGSSQRFDRIGWLAAAVVAAIAETAMCQLPVAPEPFAPAATPAAAVPSAGPPAVDEPALGKWLLEHILHEALPTNYEDNKKWGTTKEVFDGWHIKADGLKISTKRKWKRVEHGTWKRYRITMLDPEHNLHVRLSDLQSTGPGRTRATILVQTRVHAWGELQEWQRGIRLVGVGAEAQADLELRMTVHVQGYLDPGNFATDLVLDPVVEAAEIRMPSFKLTRVGKADGPIVRELGDGLEHLLDRLLEEKNQELATRLNRQIEKKRDQFRISPSDALKKGWSQWLLDLDTNASK